MHFLIIQEQFKMSLVYSSYSEKSFNDQSNHLSPLENDDLKNRII